MSTRRTELTRAGRPALRGEGLPRHVDRRPRRGAGRPEGLALRAHRLEAGPALRDAARGRGRVPRARSTRSPTTLPAVEQDPPRAARRTCASSPSSSTSPPSSSASGATSRASGATSSSPSGAATRSGSARSSARAASSASCAPTSTTRRAALLFLSAANWAYTWLQPGRDTDELADRFFALLVDGMRGYSTPVASPVTRVPFSLGMRPP